MSRKKLSAVALNYNGASPPLVTAKGEGRLARQMIAAAKSHGIPIEQDEELTALLSKVRIKTEIPETLYLAVAQLLAYLYHLNQQEEH